MKAHLNVVSVGYPRTLKDFHAHREELHGTGGRFSEVASGETLLTRSFRRGKRKLDVA